MTWPDFDTDRDAVIARARQAGVTHMITIGAGQGLEGNTKAVALAALHDDISVAIGIHPHDATACTADALAALEALATDPKVVAIGEIGLDYHYDYASHTAQHAAFRAQLDLARRLDLPILLHQREAETDLLAILDEFFPFTIHHPPAQHHWCPRCRELCERPSTCRGIQHCFGGSIRSRGQSPTLANVGGRTAPPDSPPLSSLMDFAHQLLSRGFLLGIGGVVTFKKSEALRTVIQAVPLDRLVLETDAPYLAPIPYRGKRNEPAYMLETARMVAAVTGVAIEDVLRITTDTARRLLSI